MSPGCEDKTFSEPQSFWTYLSVTLFFQEFITKCSKTELQTATRTSPMCLQKHWTVRDFCIYRLPRFLRLVCCCVVVSISLLLMSFLFYCFVCTNVTAMASWWVILHVGIVRAGSISSTADRVSLNVSKSGFVPMNTIQATGSPFLGSS